ncbi:hypothetical protein PIB30_028985 [Stylosanthes scabra]|uniref:Uncharacterized protein n=1 Tax=Stylosanthes scabra TaxID=79078 RepID=A0ABU6VE89_9FABA|nr:hypothetical protein [Stylosanthes scabra]
MAPVSLKDAIAAVAEKRDADGDCAAVGLILATAATTLAYHHRKRYRLSLLHIIAAMHEEKEYSVAVNGRAIAVVSSSTIEAQPPSSLVEEPLLMVVAVVTLEKRERTNPLEEERGVSLELLHGHLSSHRR